MGAKQPIVYLVGKRGIVGFGYLKNHSYALTIKRKSFTSLWSSSFLSCVFAQRGTGFIFLEK